MNVLSKFSKEEFYKPISGLSFGVFRIAFGLLLIIDAWKHIYTNYAGYLYSQQYLFRYEFFEWIPLYPEQWMLEWHYWAMLATSVFVTIGLFYRINIILLTLLFTYSFFLDQIDYLNHYYLTIIYLFLMCFLPMHARLSIDARLRKYGPQDIPQWTLLIVLIQTEIVLLYAGLVKLNSDWLFMGEPLGMWLRERAHWHFFGDLIFQDWFILAGAWWAMLIHLIIGPMLLFQKTRLFAIGMYIPFHLLNSYTFEIGIFPYMTIGATLLFLRPDWPAMVTNKLVQILKLPIQFLEQKNQALPVKFPRIVISVLFIWLIFQILLPLRFMLYPSNVAWSEEGHKFAWRMKLRDKEATEILFTVRDPVSKEEWIIDPHNVFSDHVMAQVGERINLILQYAHHLEASWKEKGYEDVEVMVYAPISLNGRKPVPAVDPDFDLTTVEWTIWPEDWIKPNNEPLLHWTERKW